MDLAAIQARAEKATEGPWHWEDWSLDDGPDKFSLVAPPHTNPGGASTMFPDLGNRLLKDENEEISEQDRDFIAHARTDIPLLLTRIAELTEALKEIGGQKMADSLSPEEYADADFEGAYDACIRRARTALGDQKP